MMRLYFSLLACCCLSCFGQVSIRNAKFQNAVLAVPKIITCSTVYTNRIADATNSAIAIGQFVTFTNATYIIPASTFQGCSVYFAVAAIGSPTFNLNAAIMSDDGQSPSHPNIVLKGCNETISATTIAASPAIYILKFTFAVQYFTAGTKFWVTLKTDNNDSNNYIIWYNSGSFLGNATEDYNGSNVWVEESGFLSQVELIGN